jgi:hypothetical protein
MRFKMCKMFRLIEDIKCIWVTKIKHTQTNKRKVKTRKCENKIMMELNKMMFIQKEKNDEQRTSKLKNKKQIRK